MRVIAVETWLLCAKLLMASNRHHHTIAISIPTNRFSRFYFASKERIFFSKFVFMPAARIPKSSKSKSFHTLKSRKIHQCLFIGDGMQMGVSFLIQNTKYWDHFKLIQIYYFECVKCPVLLIIHSFIIINLLQL